jgi:hypothetical protein
MLNLKKLSILLLFISHGSFADIATDIKNPELSIADVINNALADNINYNEIVAQLNHAKVNEDVLQSAVTIMIQQALTENISINAMEQNIITMISATKNNNILTSNIASIFINSSNNAFNKICTKDKNFSPTEVAKDCTATAVEESNNGIAQALIIADPSLMDMVTQTIINNQTVNNNISNSAPPPSTPPTSGGGGTSSGGGGTSSGGGGTSNEDTTPVSPN